ncbi:MAG: NADH-quinone oxidoreductase subunit G, partial [Mycobacteriaceae bacterium]|nr:NADH-quinone oxidoreductase subunit G [Mycobacteriaceae bacterium]
DASSDARVLDALAEELGVDLRLPTPAAAREELLALGVWNDARPAAPTVMAQQAATPGPGEAVLTGWRMLLDSGRLQDGEPHLAATARPPVARLSARSAAEIGAVEGALVTISTAVGAITLPLAVTDLPDQVVWLPLNSPGSAVHTQLGVALGNPVAIGLARVDDAERSPVEERCS